MLAILGGLVGVLVIGIVVLAAVVVSSSGGSHSSSSNTAASSSNSSGNSGNGTAQPKKSSSGGGSNSSGGSGNVLHLAGNDPLTLDPALAFDVDSSAYIVEIFGGLVQLDQNLNVIPDIAASMPTVSPDGTVYTFKLRTDVVFQNDNKRV